MRHRSAGTHLIVDGYVQDPSVFNEKSLRSFFVELAGFLGMTLLQEPVLLEVPIDESKLKQVEETGVFLDEGGITGFVVISTSHMSIHCWPLRSFFSLDVFSCKDFSSPEALGWICTFLGATHINADTLLREKPPLPPPG
jgi:S-adenosylmethionine decarboxylase